MIVANERLVFMHVPKTGGIWAVRAMVAAGVPLRELTELPVHPRLEELPSSDARFRFAFVRHPLDWWRSYWGYRMRVGWEDWDVDRLAGCDDFGEFIERLLIHMPGKASEMFEARVGRHPGGVEFIGRYERLADDLCTALRLAGVPFNEGRLRACSPVNMNDYGTNPALYTPAAAERMAAAESAAIDRFYPWDPIPFHLVSGPPSATRRPTLARQLERAELALRDARAELAASRIQTAAASTTLGDANAELSRCMEILSVRDNELRECSKVLGEAESTLASIQDSAIMRWSAPLRRAWYHLRASFPRVATRRGLVARPFRQPGSSRIRRCRGNRGARLRSR